MRKMAWMAGLVLAGVTIGGGWAATRTEAAASPLTAPPGVDPRPMGMFGQGPEVAVTLPGARVGRGVSVGTPGVFASLALYPIYGVDQPDTPPVVPLHVALAEGHATVRELPQKKVGTLRFQNDGIAPALALTGTIFSGGEQDRMAAHDVLLPPGGEALRLAVFCVELNRWTPSRKGIRTKGRFGTLPILAGADLRATAQLSDQRQVWEMVDAINAAHCEQADGAALATTLEDPIRDQVQHRLAARLDRFLEEVPASEHLVGVAVAVGGEFRSARVFASRALFASFRSLITRTAAFEVAMREVLAKREETSPTSERPAAAQVAAFMRHLERAPDYQEEVDVSPASTTKLMMSHRGFGTATAWRAPGGDSVPLTASYVAHPKKPKRGASCKL